MNCLEASPLHPCLNSRSDGALGEYLQLHSSDHNCKYRARADITIFMHKDISGDVLAAQANETHMPYCQDYIPTREKVLRA